MSRIEEVRSILRAGATRAGIQATAEMLLSLGVGHAQFTKGRESLRSGPPGSRVLRLNAACRLASARIRLIRY